VGETLAPDRFPDDEASAQHDPEAFLRSRGFDPAADPASLVEPQRPFFSTMRCTALWEASHAGALHCVQWLFERPGGPETVRVPNNYGRTPLFAACYEGHLDVAQWLYAHGAAADVGLKDKDGFTALTATCRREKQDMYFVVVRWLSNLKENQPAAVKYVDYH